MTLSTQLYTMLAMIGVGAWLGAAIDTYGRFLKREKRAKWIVFIHDILFWLLQGLIAFYILLMVNEGELRFYILIALVCGFAAYQSLFRYFYLSLLETIIQLVINLYRFLENLVRMLVIKPIQLLVQALIILLLGIWKFVHTILRFLLLVVWRLVKIGVLPFKWIGMLLWKLTPKVIKKYLQILFKKLEGFFTLVKNRKHSIMNRVKNFWKKR
ncbi:spore cortex biosynthesis protein YabQ [Sutcliffiella horikoshii]|uniref:spore cortex biosynthesis protein YabQ n=1 Tax=Sutcliffiella horikoshii TaxID=79883 RepID=UPI0007D07231|nr:spore cortex biosynthesis protein YabQ [Sutcliffiella horikoshii]MCM3620566.1 spore cortex biosynthesis protein YabQ [Sutcliffiella horikoshii]